MFRQNTSFLEAVVRRSMTLGVVLMLAACSRFAVAEMRTLEYRVAAFDGYSEFTCVRSGSSVCYVAVGKPNDVQFGSYRIAAGERLRMENPKNDMSYCVSPDGAQEWPKCSSGLWTGALKTSHSAKQLYADSK